MLSSDEPLDSAGSALLPYCVISTVLLFLNLPKTNEWFICLLFNRVIRGGLESRQLHTLVTSASQDKHTHTPGGKGHWRKKKRCWNQTWDLKSNLKNFIWCLHPKTLPKKRRWQKKKVRTPYTHTHIHSRKQLPKMDGWETHIHIHKQAKHHTASKINKDMETKHTHTRVDVGHCQHNLSFTQTLQRGRKWRKKRRKTKWKRKEPTRGKKRGWWGWNMKRRVGEVCVSRKRGHNYSEVLTRN